MNNLNVTEILTYCKLLSLKPDSPHTWAIFSSGKPVPGHGVVHATPVEIIKRVQELFNGPTETAGDTVELHSCINDTNLEGRRTDNIVSCRTLVVDRDDPWEADAVRSAIDEYKPSFVVRSSPVKFHLYWRVMSSMPLSRWRQYQLGMAWQLGGDYNAAAPTAMIRVPGVQRLTKSGELFMPSIVYTSPAPGMLSEAGLLSQFKDLPSWSLAGEKAVSVQRAELGRLARAALKGKLPDSADIAGVGRNVVLYGTVKSALIHYGLNDSAPTIELALETASRCNSRFQVELEQGEVVMVARSALRHAEIAIGRIKAEQEESVSVLVEPIEKVEIAPVISEAAAGVNGNGHHKPERATQDSSTQRVNGPQDKAEPELEVSEEAGNQDDAPEWYSDAARDYAQWLFDHVPDITRQLKAAATTKNYSGVSELYMRHWSEIGIFTEGDIRVFVRCTNAAGRSVITPRWLTEDEFMALSKKVVGGLWGRAILKQRQDKAAGVKVGSMLGMPKTIVLRAIARECWDEKLMARRVSVQPPTVVCFQNGWLDGLKFKRDKAAPLNHTHPLWAYFDVNVARQFLGLVKKYDVYSAARAVVPVFCRYMNDWFPGDTGTVGAMLSWFGLCMTTEARLQKFGFFFGPTRAGKGSLTQLLCQLLGNDNYCVTNYSAFTDKFEKATMRGKLVVVIDEVEGTAKEHEKRMGSLKALLSGDRSTFEKKYAHPEEATLIGKIIMQSNKELACNDAGGAIRARVLPFAFAQSFRDKPNCRPKDEILAVEMDKLATISALTWMIRRGAVDPFAFKNSASMRLGSATMDARLNLVGAVLDQFVVSAPGKRVPVAALVELCQAYAEEEEMEVPRGLGKLVGVEMKAKFGVESVLVKERAALGGFSVKRYYPNISLNAEQIRTCLLGATEYNFLSEFLGEGGKKYESIN